MNSTYKNKTAIIQYFYIYLMLSSAGMAFPAYIGNDFFIILLSLMGIYYFFFKSSLYNLQKQYTFFIGILFFSMTLVIIGSTLSLGTALSITSILLIVYATYKIDPLHYIQRLIKSIYYISIISIILFSITRLLGFDFFSTLFPHLYPSIHRDNQIYSYGGFIYRFVPLHSDRNCGPFGEPGQYQCILSVALYFTLFRASLFNPKNRIRYLVVFFITLITTLSTSGYIGMAILIICFSLHSSKAINKQVKYVFIAMTLGIILFISTTKLGNDFINIAVYDKIYENGQLDLSNKSGGARTASIIGVLSTIYHHPITLFGVGYDELQKMGLEGCAGFLYLLLAIGVMPFFILFGFCFHQIFKYNKGIWDIIVRILLVINMGLGQPHIMNFALFTMMLYPYFIANSLKKARISHVRNC
jgi:hypothetical protein